MVETFPVSTHEKTFSQRSTAARRSCRLVVYVSAGIFLFAVIIGAVIAAYFLFPSFGSYLERIITHMPLGDPNSEKNTTTIVSTVGSSGYHPNTAAMATGILPTVLLFARKHKAFVAVASCALLLSLAGSLTVFLVFYLRLPQYVNLDHTSIGVSGGSADGSHGDPRTVIIGVVVPVATVVSALIGYSIYRCVKYGPEDFCSRTPELDAQLTPSICYEGFKNDYERVYRAEPEDAVIGRSVLCSLNPKRMAGVETILIFSETGDWDRTVYCWGEYTRKDIFAAALPEKCSADSGVILAYGEVTDSRKKRRKHFMFVPMPVADLGKAKDFYFELQWIASCMTSHRFLKYHNKYFKIKINKAFPLQVEMAAY